ncbi:unnamed protein product [Gordionus sp. m RMFG-2023]
MSLDLAQSLYSSHFIENIWSDKLSLDSYEPTNLISLNNIQRSNGYITEYYIKPPVNLYINFKYPIDLNQIVLEPQSASKNGGLVQGGNMSKNNITIDENNSLTYEIMKEPVILPSGHYIDITSLNKLMNEQKKFGNFPIDPFTGIPFDNNYLPSLNKKLKSEVEKYCSKLSSTKKITKFDNFINKSLHQSSNNINSIENDFLNSSKNEFIHIQYEYIARNGISKHKTTFENSQKMSYYNFNSNENFY